jgi:hypothetical protein
MWTGVGFEQRLTFAEALTQCIVPEETQDSPKFLGRVELYCSQLLRLSQVWVTVVATVK